MEGNLYIDNDAIFGCHIRIIRRTLRMRTSAQIHLADHTYSSLIRKRISQHFQAHLIFWLSVNTFCIITAPISDASDHHLWATISQ